MPLALKYERIGKNPQRIVKIKSFINRHNWDEIGFPSRSKDWKKSESNNKSIALNIFIGLIILKK